MTTRFAVALHVLIFLQKQEGKAVTSELLASSVNTNPSLIRRTLSRLKGAGLTASKMGFGGGALLARPAEKITLLDVHQAVEDKLEIIPIHPSPHPMCPVGRNIKRVLSPKIEDVEEAVRDQLMKTTIADLANEISRVT